jgi:hypothetical protein
MRFSKIDVTRDCNNSLWVCVLLADAVAAIAWLLVFLFSISNFWWEKQTTLHINSTHTQHALHKWWFIHYNVRQTSCNWISNAVSSVFKRLCVWTWNVIRPNILFLFFGQFVIDIEHLFSNLVFVIFCVQMKAITDGYKFSDIIVKYCSIGLYWFVPFRVTTLIATQRAPICIFQIKSTRPYILWMKILFSSLIVLTWNEQNPVEPRLQ